MANFFDGLLNVVKHPLDEAKFLKNVVTGKTSLKDAPGAHQKMMNDITVPILGNNKVAKNSDAIAGTIVVTAGDITGTDSVAETITGTGISGTIDYDTKGLSITFSLFSL